MNIRRSLAVLGLVAAVAAVAVAGTAFAQTPTPTPSTAGGTNYKDFFLNKLADALNITRDQLNSALTQAKNETVDQAVQDGKITQDRADAIKAQPGLAPFGFEFGRGDRHERMFMGGADALNAVAQVLNMTPQQLMDQLRSGKTLADLAQGNEQAVKDAIANAEKPKLDQAVANGRITQDQENQILDKIRNAELSQLGGHWGKGFGRGWRRGFAPPQNQASPTPSPSFGPASRGMRAL